MRILTRLCDHDHEALQWLRADQIMTYAPSLWLERQLTGCEVRHLPGQHNQATHGGGRVGPGGGVDLIAAGHAERMASDAIDAASPYAKEGSDLAGRRLYAGGGVGPHGDEALHHIATQQGFDGAASTVSKREMNKGVKRGDVEMYRGVRASHDGTKTAEQVHAQVHSGPAHYGLGYSGNGYYFSNNRSIASEYGSVARYALHRDSKVVDYRDLQHEQGNYLRSLPEGSAAKRVFSDPGRYAAARGYDAIRWRRGEEAGLRAGMEDEYIVLNRSALLVEV